jgi:hypothetical protein
MDQQTVDELLCHCLGMGTDETRVARLEQLSPSDWDGVIQQANRHSVTPLLYRCLKTLGPGTIIPAGIMQRLQEIYLFDSARRNVRLYHQLSKVLKMLQNDGIPVIALKGVHLAEVVYGDLALRPMDDMDLLVRTTDLSRIEAKLLEMGYVPPENKSWYVENHRHFHYVLPNGGVPVEVHWNIQSPTSLFKLDVEKFWERAQPAAIAGIEVLVLSPEDLLLHLCLHVSFSHKFRIRLISFCDISETVRYYRDEMDWEQVQLRACQWGVGKYVYLTLHLARELLGAAVPDEVLDALKPDGFDPRVAAGAREQIFADESDSPSLSSLSKAFVQLWGPEGLQDKAILFLKSVFPSPEVMAQMYPAPPDSPRIYFYYPVRLKDLLLRYGRAAWRLLHRDKEMVMLVERKNNKTALIDWLASA